MSNAWHGKVRGIRNQGTDSVVRAQKSRVGEGEVERESGREVRKYSLKKRAHTHATGLGKKEGREREREKTKRVVEEKMKKQRIKEKDTEIFHFGQRS